MPLVTRAVFGFVYRTDGTALAAAPITIRAYPNVFQPDGSVAPASLLTPITNSVGRYDVVLVVNARYLIGIPGDVFEIIVPSGAGSVSVESLRATTGVVMTNTFQLLLDAALLLKENALGNPGAAGQFLTSTLLGARSWATPPAGGGGASALTWLQVGVGGNPAFDATGGWSNLGTGYLLAYALDPSFIYISGWIFRGAGTPAGGSPIFTIPSITVTARQDVVVSGNSIPSTIRAIADGSGVSIQFWTGANVLYLDGVSFVRNRG